MRCLDMLSYLPFVGICIVVEWGKGSMPREHASNSSLLAFRPKPAPNYAHSFEAQKNARNEG